MRVAEAESLARGPVVGIRDMQAITIKGRSRCHPWLETDRLSVRDGGARPSRIEKPQPRRGCFLPGLLDDLHCAGTVREPPSTMVIQAILRSFAITLKSE